MWWWCCIFSSSYTVLMQSSVSPMQREHREGEWTLQHQRVSFTLGTNGWALHCVGRRPVTLWHGLNILQVGKVNIQVLYSLAGKGHNCVCVKHYSTKYITYICLLCKVYSSCGFIFSRISIFNTKYYLIYNMKKDAVPHKLACRMECEIACIHLMMGEMSQLKTDSLQSIKADIYKIHLG